MVLELTVIVAYWFEIHAPMFQHLVSSNSKKSEGSRGEDHVYAHGFGMRRMYTDIQMFNVSIFF